MHMSRAPRGIPTGGQFVASSRSEPTVSLAGAAADPLAYLTTGRDGTIRDRRTGEAIPDGVLTEEDKANVFDPWEAGGVRRAMQQSAEPQALRRRGLREDEFDDLAKEAPAPARNLGFLGGGRQIMDWDTRTPVDFDSLTESEQARVRKTARDMGFPDPGRSGLRKTVEHIGDEIGETVDALGEVTGHIVDVQRGDVTPEVEGSFVGWGQMLPKFMRRKDREAPAAEPEQESTEARNRRLANVFGDAARAAERMDSASSRMRDLSGGR
jgi:hypothetical protein